LYLKDIEWKYLQMLVTRHRLDLKLHTLS